MKRRLKNGVIIVQRETMNPSLSLSSSADHQRRPPRGMTKKGIKKDQKARRCHTSLGIDGETNFMSLPGELRNEIYHLDLVKRFTMPIRFRARDAHICMGHPSLDISTDVQTPGGSPSSYAPANLAASRPPASISDSTASAYMSMLTR